MSKPLLRHVGAGAVAVRAAKPQDPHALMDIDPVFYAHAALRGVLVIVLVMVAVDIQHRTVGQRHQKLQIAPVQVPAGQDQVELIQPACLVVVIQILCLLVRYGQNPHTLPPFLSSLCPSR